MGVASEVAEYREKKNIPKKEHPHRDLSTALRFGRDDKAESGYSPGDLLSQRRGL